MSDFSAINIEVGSQLPTERIPCANCPAVEDIDEQKLKSTKDSKVKVYGVQRCQEWATLNLDSGANSVNPRAGYNGMINFPSTLSTLLPPKIYVIVHRLGHTLQWRIEFYFYSS